ncbi:hypothetical protein FTUN_8816 [Frigoriglobus tundricola]|uniref:Uncharacterized protein n=1 Tax=Frigoriglobus tundricola TaxID=2774151 RepID=A0A6M5Z5S1_9BACT|nr:hypothetical protein FTUN_8816 [Frigoriglobus tundricola]
MVVQSVLVGRKAHSRGSESITEPTIRDPDQIRRDCARKLRAVQISDHFQALLGYLLGKD